ACRVNLDAFYAALATPGITPETFWADWRPDMEPGMEPSDSQAVQAFKDILRKGLDAVTAALYIRGNLMFHTFPLSPDPKWLKAGGIPALFDSGRPLKEHEHIWSILCAGTAPSKQDVLAEKRQAIAQARSALRQLSQLEGRLPDALLRIHRNAWRNLEAVAVSVHALCETVYAARAMHAGRRTAIAEPVRPQTAESGSMARAGVRPEGSYGALMLEPLAQLTERVAAEAWAERDLLQDCLRRFPGVHDVILPGGLRDDGRCCRSAMHASHAWLHESGLPVRQIGNPVFPNGWLEVELIRTGVSVPGRLLFRGIPDPAGFRLSRPGRTRSQTFILDGEGWVECRLTPEWVTALSTSGSIRIRIGKAGRSYPLIAAILLV
ncbi:MAG: hypothetical protein PHR35_12430, partial [Kiritimatiellae bacterium]|nr:hypothetical protein [Kiritimatiellia bacterium]